MKNKIEISFVPYQDGKWELIIKDANTHEEAYIDSDTKEIDDQTLSILGRLMPCCVYTTYEEI